MTTTTYPGLAKTSFDREQALAGLTERATRYGWTTVVNNFDEHFNLVFFRDLPNGHRELLWTRLSATGRITVAERILGDGHSEVFERQAFTKDKRTAVQLAMSA